MSLLFEMDPTKGRISRSSAGPSDFGEGNNFVYRKRRHKRKLASPLISSLRGKIDGDHPAIAIKGKRKNQHVRFRIRGNNSGNERSELAHGPLLDVDKETYHFAFQFRVKGDVDEITGTTAYVLQGWEPVEQPRFGVRLDRGGQYDLTSRSGGGTTRNLRTKGKRWNTVVASFNDDDGIIWRNKKGKEIARSPGGFMVNEEDGLRLKFGFYGGGANGADLNVDVKHFAVANDLQSILEGLG